MAVFGRSYHLSDSRFARPSVERMHMAKSGPLQSKFGDKGDLTYGGQVDMGMAQKAVAQLLAAFGLDINDEDFRETPRRVAEQYAELLAGLFHEPPKMTVFSNDVDHSELVLLKDIFFTSVCSHHLAVFSGKAHIAYVPGKKLSGLSKLARVLDYFAARPQLQERLAVQIADFIEKELRPKGVAVHLTGSHGCVATRGALKSGSSMVTTVLRGVFAKAGSRFRDDFFQGINR